MLRSGRGKTAAALEVLHSRMRTLSGNPSALASLISAIIAASVALVVFTITQLLTRRRERTQFLAPKLEELYLLINKVAEDNARFFKLIYLTLQGVPSARQQMAAIDDLELYGAVTAKKIIMYIRLYFLPLARIHQMLFNAQHKLNALMFELHSDKPPDLQAVKNASGQVGHFLRLMEEEIIDNRDHLLEDHFFPRRYRYTTRAAIESPEPHPEGPIMHLPNIE
jgi:hypothetical protein